MPFPLIEPFTSPMSASRAHVAVIVVPPFQFGTLLDSPRQHPPHLLVQPPRSPHVPVPLPLRPQHGAIAGLGHGLPAVLNPDVPVVLYGLVVVADADMRVPSNPLRIVEGTTARGHPRPTAPPSSRCRRAREVRRSVSRSAERAISRSCQMIVHAHPRKAPQAKQRSPKKTVQDGLIARPPGEEEVPRSHPVPSARRAGPRGRSAGCSRHRNRAPTGARGPLSPDRRCPWSGTPWCRRR